MIERRIMASREAEWKIDSGEWSSDEKFFFKDVKGMLQSRELINFEFFMLYIYIYSRDRQMMHSLVKTSKRNI